MSHRRYNPLVDEWVLCSRGRLDRPWQGERDTSRPTPVAYDGECYICPGNARASGHSNPSYEDVFVFDNDFPALTPDGDASDPRLHPHPHELLKSEPASGR